MPQTNQEVLDGLREAASRLSTEEVDEKLFGDKNLGRRMKGTSPGTYDGEPLPPVAPAPPFRTPPNVVGGKSLQDAVQGILRMAPELRGQVRNISHSPDRGVMDTMDDSDIPIEEFSGTNLRGQTNMHTRDVYINPSLDQEPRQLKKTLAHEMSHIQGQNELNASATGALWDKKFPMGDIELPTDPIEALLKALEKSGIDFKGSGIRGR